MTKKQEFIEFIDELMVAAPDVAATMSDDVKAYLEVFRGKDADKPLFTDNGKLILKFLQENLDRSMWKARDIGEGLFISSRAVSGAMRKLVSDGFVEKVGQDPVVYAITDKGKTIDLNNIEEN